MTPPPPLAQKYARFLYHHHRWIIVGAVALTFISIVISSLFLENRKGILDLYSSDNPVHRKFSEYVEELKKLNEEVTSPQSTLSHTLKAHNLNDFLRGLSHTIQRELGSENQKIDWKEAQLGLSDLDVIFS